MIVKKDWYGGKFQRTFLGTSITDYRWHYVGYFLFWVIPLFVVRTDADGGDQDE